jgi:hypothetical protein
VITVTRVLITGSRDWEDRDLIYEVLNGLEAKSTIVHGDCPTGADKMADEWADCQPDIRVERYPADWETYGRSAGPRRNKKMVNLGADVCLAFIKNNSRGASGTAKLAEEAGIKVIRYEQ